MCSGIMTWGREVLALIKESPRRPHRLTNHRQKQAVLLMLMLMQIQEVPYRIVPT